MPCRHTAPWCWGLINKSQDEIKNMMHVFICPHCKLPITNEDVTDTIQLIDLVTLIRVKKDSQVKLFGG